MSVKLVAQEIRRFLATPDPEVICVMGKWGVGKTFAWNQYLKTATSESSVSLKKYSYVSLFGQNSLEKLKYAIFEGTVNLNQKELNPSWDTLKKGWNELKKWSRKTSSVLNDISKAKGYSTLLERSFFLSVHNQIICIDDLERVGDGLSVKDVLGLVSSLKDQRKCKVVLLLNDEEFKVKAADDFKSQLEKVIDIEMRFEPTSQEAADIGVDPSISFHEKLKQISISLGIVNIRVIRKIQRLAARLKELLVEHDKRVFEATLPSIVLFGWGVYQPKLAPLLDFVKDFNPYGYLFDKSKKETDQEKNWRLLLGAINFANFDEFDQLLLESMQRGYFDAEAIEKAAIEFDKKLLLQDQDNSFNTAWGKYHNSFANNGDEVLDEMFAAFNKGLPSISPQNLDGTIRLFRDLGREKQADEMIALYMSGRNEKAEFYDPNMSSFLYLKDSKLKEAFAEKLASFKDNRSPKDILIKIAQSSGWNPKDIKALAQVTFEQFNQLFKETEGDDLRIIVSQALKFGKYTDADDDMKTITFNAEKALKLIAGESLINKERVQSYGVTIEADPTPAEFSEPVKKIYEISQKRKIFFPKKD